MRSNKSPWSLQPPPPLRLLIWREEIICPVHFHSNEKRRGGVLHTVPTMGPKSFAVLKQVFTIQIYKMQRLAKPRINVLTFYLIVGTNITLRAHLFCNVPRPPKASLYVWDRQTSNFWPQGCTRSAPAAGSKQHLLYSSLIAVLDITFI